MLSEKEMIKIALEECVSIIGKDLVYAHKDLCCASYGFNSNGVFEYIFGIDTEERPYKMGDETPMEYYAFVSVDPKTGAVKRNYEESVLPNNL